MTILWVATIALVVRGAQTAEGAYRELQARLGTARTLQMEIVSGGSERSLKVGFARGGRGYRYGHSNAYRTDGRRASEDDDLDFFNRKARSDELRRELAMPGFESFYDPEAKVTGQGEVRTETNERGSFLALDIAINGQPIVLYLDPKSRLPAGYRPQAGKPDDIGLSYFDIRLDAPIPPAWFQVTPLPPAERVYARLLANVRRLKEVSIEQRFDGGVTSIIVAKGPRDYRRISPYGTVVRKGAWVSVSPPGKPGHRIRAIGQGAPEHVPGFEALLNPEMRGTVFGETAVVRFVERGTQVDKCYAVQMRFASLPNNHWTLFVGMASLTPHGYTRYRNGKMVERATYKWRGEPD